jgi:hypothetical protein
MSMMVGDLAKWYRHVVLRIEPGGPMFAETGFNACIEQKGDAIQDVGCQKSINLVDL